MEQKLLEKVRQIEDPVRRRAMFIALLSQEITTRGGRRPIVVGGQAVEIYTQGSYTTGDIDLKYPREITEKVLMESGFSKRGRNWFNRELDIYIDLLGETLDEGMDAEERASIVEIGNGLSINVLSIEDLVIDRLNASKCWKDTDSFIWAKVLLKVKKVLGGPLDMEYLKKRAQQEGISELLREAFQDEPGKDS